uniref:JmjC domain-containing protein n=1 Tax=Neobodo designis TaxID=312471 RepID=A0A7S1LWB8_NEODS
MADVLDDLFGDDEAPTTTASQSNDDGAHPFRDVPQRLRDAASEALSSVHATVAELSKRPEWVRIANALAAASAAVVSSDADSASAAAEHAACAEAALWELLQERKQWPEPCTREAFIASQVILAWATVARCASEADVGAAAVAATRHLDRAFVMCGRPELVVMIGFIEAFVPQREAVSGGMLPARCDMGGVDVDTIASAGGIARMQPSEETATLGDVAATFEAAYFRKRTPVVLANGLITKGWAALEAWRDVGALATAHGHRIVPVEVGRHSHGGHDGADSSSSWRECFLTLGEFVDQFLRPSLQRFPEDLKASPRGSLPPAAAVGYVAQHGLFEQIPKLLRDIRPPAVIANRCNGGRGVLKMNTWLGTHGTVTPLHYDSYDNFLVQVAGAKYVRLYAVDQTPFLHADDAGAGGNLAQRNICPVDVEHPDLERFPKFAEAVHTDVVLLPGDALFIPQGVWHYVRSLAPSFSVNFWF